MSEQEASGSNPLPDYVHAMMAEDQAEILRLRDRLEYHRQVMLRVAEELDPWGWSHDQAMAAMMRIDGCLGADASTPWRERERETRPVWVDVIDAPVKPPYGSVERAAYDKCDGCSEPNRCGCQHGASRRSGETK